MRIQFTDVSGMGELSTTWLYECVHAAWIQRTSYLQYPHTEYIRIYSGYLQTQPSDIKELLKITTITPRILK